MTKIFITIEGGVIQEVFASGEVEVLIVDYDVESNEEVKTNIYGEDYIGDIFDATFDPELVEMFFAQYKKQLKN